MEPPVAAPSLPADADRPPPPPIDFGYEKRIVEAAAGPAPDRLAAFLAAAPPGAFLDAPAARLVAAGGAPVALSLAQAAQVSAARVDEARVAEFAGNYEKLAAMGFAPPLAAGALLRHGGRLAAATDACLAASV